MRGFAIGRMFLLAAWIVAAALPTAAQDARVDIRKIPCSDLDKWEDGDRVAAIFFYYGFHTAKLNRYSVSPANLERNVRSIVEFCDKNPTMPIYRAVPKAFKQ